MADYPADLAAKWGLIRDGEPMSGWMSQVWPVLDADGRRVVLKIGRPHAWGDAEPEVLAAWSERQRGRTGPRVVEVLRADPERRALLLERLDPARTLDLERDVDEASEVVAQVLALVHEGGGAPRSPRVESIGPTFEAFAEDIRRHRTEDLLPRRDVEHALETLGWAVEAMRTGTVRTAVLHNDCHYLNVLHTLTDVDTGVDTGEDTGGDSPWRAIDPLPVHGIPELELVPSLRNRWADAAATGDGDAALRRRARRMAATAGFDADLAIAIAQAVATRAVLEGMPPDHLFAQSYGAMAHW